MQPDPQPTFRALSDPTRRAILAILSNGEQSIGQITDQFDVTRPAIKKHLSILEQGNLISVVTQGRTRINRLNPDGFNPARDWLTFFDSYWDTSLAALKSTIEKDLN